MRTFHGITKSFSIYKQTWMQLKAAQDSNLSADSVAIFEKKRYWAQSVFDTLGIQCSSLGNPCERPGTLYVGNHLSYLDIPLLMRFDPQVAFVAKKELESWPIFGKAASLVGTVYVHREKQASRNQVKEQIAQALLAGRSIALFPSGTTTLNEDKPWRKGAFEIAAQSGAWLQPFRIIYSQPRVCAYIDRDFFPTHLSRLALSEDIRATIEFGTPRRVKDPIKECEEVQKWTQGMGVLSREDSKGKPYLVDTVTNEPLRNSVL
jgi:1-acyl-sn-glycerol-3-phosphate acyltransferase